MLHYEWTVDGITLVIESNQIDEITIVTEDGSDQLKLTLSPELALEIAAAMTKLAGELKGKF